MKKLLLKLYYFGELNKQEIEENYENIRNVEWTSVNEFIVPNSNFLDVGCGSGYFMLRAMNEKNCNVHGIDPQTGTHDGKVSNNGLSIMHGIAEKIPFEKDKFDVVFSSHVLEHVDDETKSLREMSRVLKDNGVLVIGMPTAQMAWINLWTELLFTTHQRMFNFLFGRLSFISTSHTPFINVFIPFSHSTHRAKTVLFDLKYYKLENWKKIIEKEFKIEKVILPAFYPYPKYRQFFKMKKNYKKSSSVFFICSKLN